MYNYGIAIIKGFTDFTSQQSAKYYPYNIANNRLILRQPGAVYNIDFTAVKGFKFETLSEAVKKCDELNNFSHPK